MDIRFYNSSGDGWQTDCALAFICEGENPAASHPALAAAAPWLDISPGLRDAAGKKDERTLLYGHPDNAIPRVLICGLGPKEDFSARRLRDAVAHAARLCRDRGYARVGLPAESLERLALLTESSSRDDLIAEAVAAAGLALHKGGLCRSTPDADEADQPVTIGLLFAEPHTPEPAQRAARRAEAETGGVLLARDLSNTPANLLPPAELAEKARSLAASGGFACTVLDAGELRRLGMGALLAVGNGSENEPRFIILEHCPKGRENDKPVIVAGKGITFDTGGISLKPPAKMHEMKGDMGGAAAVLGLFAAVAAMPDADELPRLIGLIPTAENMPGGRATRPGDVVETLSGKTVEILNTDAEGRLVLCDALTYAQREWTPAALIDIATLTGACVIALGDYGAGLFTDDAVLRDALLEAAAACGDLVWPLPLWDEYDENLASDVADFTNMGPREGAAVNAALFLRRFIDKKTRWAHLDIAGPGYVAKSSPTLPVPGGTGAGVRLLCRLLRDKKALAG